MMNILDDFSGNSDQIPAYEMSDNVDELFDQIISRKHWNKLDPNIIRAIIKRANKNAESVRNFVFISEYSGILENNLVQLSKNEKNDDFLLSLFALTLYRYGIGYHQQAIDTRNDEDLKNMAMLADMAYMSAILCDKYELNAYYGMAFLYSFWEDGKTSLEFCMKYKTMEDELLNTPDELLNYMQIATKQFSLKPESIKETIDEISKYAPHLLDVYAELPTMHKSRREEIEALERKIRSR